MNRPSKKAGPEHTAADPSKDMAEGEAALLEKIAAMPEPYRTIGGRLHEIIKANGPELTPRVWYGMPAYARKKDVILFFRGVVFGKTERYMTLGFNAGAKLDDGNMWPTSYALTGLTPAEEERIAVLVRKAVG